MCAAIPLLGLAFLKVCPLATIICISPNLLQTYFTSGRSYWKLCLSELVNPILVVFSAYYTASWLRFLF
jgi:hypothetical protein